jgi:hypothetical protein
MEGYVSESIVEDEAACEILPLKWLSAGWQVQDGQTILGEVTS